MFFKSKQEALLKKIDDRLHTLEQGIAAGNHTLNTLDQTTRNLDTSLKESIADIDSGISQNLSGLHSAIQKHDMALEDLLDEWAEKQSDEKNVQDKFREAEQNEKKLLELFETFQEQFQSLKRFAASNHNDAWSSQLALMEQAIEQNRRLCGISVIQECGVDVDYDLHEIVEAVDTSDPCQDKKIADIYRCGYIYKGTVIKKAQAAAYRLISRS